MRNCYGLLGIACLGLSLNEGWAESSTQKEAFTFRMPHPVVVECERIGLGLSAETKPVQWLPVQAGHSANGIAEFGSRVVLQLQFPKDLPEVIQGHELELARTITANTFILQAPDAWTAAQEAQRLASLPGVVASYPVVRRQAGLNGQYAARPGDSLFSWQWAMEHRDGLARKTGPDLNARAAWPFTMGAGVTIAVADTGVELSHPELVSRTAGAPHFDFATQTNNGMPPERTREWAHGTHVAGIAAAEINHNRMAGVAPQAKLASWVALEKSLGKLVLISDERMMDMFQYESNQVAVQNHSWNSNTVELLGPTPLEQIGLSNAVTQGREGRGVVLVWSAGNERKNGGNANDDGFANNPNAISVAAVRYDGRTASYSEPGACILVAAPGADDGEFGLFTTDLLGLDGRSQINLFPPYEDLTDYVFQSIGFKGTSAAAPHISGLAALLLSANPELTLRDVQQILILSSRHFDPTDVDHVTNGAGLSVSHNDGFGVPDAGWAVNLARGWPNRPALSRVTVTVPGPVIIPDDGLRLRVSGPGVPVELQSIQTLPGSGPHADEPTMDLPLAYVGLATNPISQNLSNRGALVMRGGNSFEEKISRVAEARAAYAVVYNYATNTSGTGTPGGDYLVLMAETDFTSIPAVSIGYSEGEALRNLFETNFDARARIELLSTNLDFTVTDTLICEQVSLRVQTDHELRGDLRITLVSPQGTRSVLQRYNADTHAGPADWTYTSTHHFYESSAGTWTACFSDQGQGAVGQVLSASLIIRGAPIVDADADGLDDDWELLSFQNLDQGPQGDPELDGYSNAREQVMGTNPNVMDVPFGLDLSRWNESIARLSWPGSTNFNYEVWAGANVESLTLITNVPGGFPETEWLLTSSELTRQFYRVYARPVP